MLLHVSKRVVVFVAIICSIAQVCLLRTIFNDTSMLSSMTRQTVTLDVPPPANRSLVILTGGLRSGEQAWTSLYKNILDPNSADLALMIEKQSSEPLYPNSTLFERAKYTWFFDDYNDWGKAIDLINGTSWRTTHLPRFKSKKNGFTILFGGIEHLEGSAIIIFMIRWFLLNHIKASDILEKYDTFVVTRTDHFYQCPHMFTELDYSNNTVWVPEGETYHGYTDRYYTISRENLLSSLNLIEPLIQEPFRYDVNKHRNSESFTKYVWDKNGFNVKSFPRVMFTTATKYDTTRWKEGGERVRGVPGLLKKYKKEYTMTQENCPPISNPTCEVGILDSTKSFCCLESCGVCGADDCATRPGGARGCCAAKIRKKAKSCDANVAPCLIWENLLNVEKKIEQRID